ncbi:ankyrin repeat domain-containing protein [Priestia megaterium]|uniref:ankyrin repeat domain-containing protein n=1 Tax=Priestia megaterium TaxID=1404 RepID=UPI00234F2E56|nr:ankyrin repeat domain-containing protein [Priestia megaterium]MDC7723262.1 ankyrin repeat domain-containing protein [Priestia megaterium]
MLNGFRFVCLMIFLMFVLTGCVEKKEMSQQEGGMTLDDMSNNELKEHLETHRDEYELYGDSVEENIKIIKFSIDQLTINSNQIKQTNSYMNNKEYSERYKQNLLSLKNYINEAEDIEDVPPLVYNINHQYLNSLELIETTAKDIEQEPYEEFSIEDFLSNLNKGKEGLQQTEAMMNKLESDISKRMNYIFSNKVSQETTVNKPTETPESTAEEAIDTKKQTKVDRKSNENLNEQTDELSDPEDVGNEASSEELLMDAILNDNFESAKSALEDPNVNVDIDIRDTRPLLEAVEEGRHDIARLLLDHKADPNLSSAQVDFVPLEAALQQSSNGVEKSAEEVTNLIHLLLDYGADPNYVSNESESDEGQTTALVTAIKQHNKEAVQLLLQYGADPNLALNNNETAATIAEQEEFGSLEELVIGEGEDID